ncbi:hypothetical protein [Kordiimonas aquimaris]|uniref:hypothetical protein n=1 Tax=Kordiimonas aquimaris TaxID=707591 RepID=UPI0021D1F821|nr:hypothetical protein [Kordiimonas aquimaris]
MQPVWVAKEKPGKPSITVGDFYAIDANAAGLLAQQEKIIEFHNAYEAADDQIFWQILLDVGIDKAEVYVFIHGMTDDDHIPYSIIDASNAGIDNKT